MRPEDFEFFRSFNQRTGMYLQYPDEQSVVAFLRGYEIGAGGQCWFTKLMDEHLQRRYRYRQSPCGWPYLIGRVALKRSISWFDAYLLVSSELLAKLKPEP